MIEVNKKCLECANSITKQTDKGFEYLCVLSKAKAKKCQDERFEEDYFKEM